MMEFTGFTESYTLVITHMPAYDEGENANSWILNIYAAYMYAHSEIFSFTKPIIHSFQYMH